MDHLLARFRPAQPDNAAPSTPPNPAPVAIMVATTETSPSTPIQEVVRYQPPTQRETRSQLDRVARADAGDLQARLDLISVDAAEEVLARRFCKHQPERSILAYLREPGDGVAPYQAASAVLEELADKTEDTAFESALVFRYIQAHGLWRGHPSSAVQSAEDLVRHLDGSDYVQANIIIGTSVQVAKRNCIRLIDEKWGAGWFEKIPSEMRDPTWVGPEGCSKRLLMNMAANAKQGFILEHVVEGWAEAVYRRNDFGERRRLGIRSKTTPYLLPDDVATLNKIAKDEDRGRRTSDTFFPGDAKEDRLRVEIIAPPSTSNKVATPPNYAEGPRPKLTTTRKKRVREEEQEEDSAEERWKESRDGRWMIKRVRNHLIRKPVEEIAEKESSRSCSPQRPPHDASIQSSKASPRPTVRPLECEGPAFGAGMRKMLGLFSELENPMYTAARCCDRCRGPLQQALRCLQGYLEPIIDDLESISTHAFGDDEASSTQDHGISPLKPRGQRNHIFLSDDSDDSDAN